jgi:hypothetical protein
LSRRYACACPSRSLIILFAQQCQNNTLLAVRL